jgi:hypothetical protein
MLDVVLFVDFLVDFASQSRQNHLLPDGSVEKPDENYVLD